METGLFTNRPGEIEYMSLITDAQHANNHNQDTFIRYLDISDLAVCFGIDDLANWAWSQLVLLLRSSDRLADCEWDSTTVLKVLSHLEYVYKIEWSLAKDFLIFLLLVLGAEAKSSHTPGIAPIRNIDICIRLYQESAGLPLVTFGYAFIRLLSLGHRSSIWADRLTSKDRATFYAAQIHLTSLNQVEDLTIKWLNSPRSYVLPKSTCFACWSKFEGIWKTSFGQCGTLDSAVPLDDVSKLLHIPWYRQRFAQAIQSSSCESGCSAAILAGVDAHILRLFLDWVTSINRSSSESNVWLYHKFKRKLT